MLYNAKKGKVKVRDMQIDYVSFGLGTKPLVLIQGLNTNGIKGAGAFLAYMYRIFAKDHKVYLFERRPNVHEGITVRDMAGDIAGAMDELGIVNADIIGVSQGGMIGQYLAIDRPDLVNKLVLVVTLSRNNEIVKGVIKHWITMTKQGDIKALVTDMAVKMYSEAYVKRYKLFMPLLTLMQKPKDPRRFIIMAESCLTCDAYDELDKIKCPVFVLGGKQDKVLGGEASIEIAEKLGCELYMYENLGHALYEEDRDFNRRIYDFLR